MTKLSVWKAACVVFVFCAATPIASRAQTFTLLASFEGSDGSHPYEVSLAQGRDGNFYGTTVLGGNNNCTNGCGTVFRVTPAGALKTIYGFCSQTNCTDGANPYAGLVLGDDGNLYGTTYAGGANPNDCVGESFGCGTIFKITPEGALTTLYSFCVAYPSCTDGDLPYAGLTQGSDGSFYGTTGFGGANGAGTIFKVTSLGKLTTLYSFCARTNCSDGSFPQAALVQATDGDFYGTNVEGGNAANCFGGCGTVFKITARGNLTTLYTFCGRPECPDGFEPQGLVEGADRNFYGVTIDGAAVDNGTAFKITPSGELTTLHSFCSQTNCADGAFPYVGLIQATDGNFYGMTGEGGNLMPCGGTSDGCGTVFEISPQGSLTTLHVFDFTEGFDPQDGLLQATNGSLYGAVWGGGSNNCGLPGCGTVFGLNMGFGPFVAFVRNPAEVGKRFGVLGQGLTGTSSVSVNGTQAEFAVKSDTFLEVTVPNGGTTGLVTVTTPTGTLTSNVPFRVLPQVLSFYPPSGAVGTMVTITGVSLTQTTEVGFGDHVPAEFTVNSDTQVTATVPSGAKTGPVGVETQGGIAISSAGFTVTP
jgi:uncharacterized repeat protein (TIGR03803 family)